MCRMFPHLRQDMINATEILLDAFLIGYLPAFILKLARLISLVAFFFIIG